MLANFSGVEFYTNKNALSSIESRLLGDKFCCQRRRCCYITFLFEYKTSVTCHKVNTQKIKNCKERQLSLKPVWNLWKPSTYWYCSIEEYSFRDFTLKKLNSDFYRYQGPMIYIHDINIHSFFVLEKSMARYSICSAWEKCVSLTEPHTTHSEFSLRVFLLNLLSVL